MVRVKKCTICKVEKPMDKFRRDKTRGDGRSYRCEACWKAYRAAPGFKKRQSDYNKKRYKNNKVKVLAANRRRKLKREYGLTPEDVERMLIGQNYSCACCKRSFSQDLGHQVDHCHTTMRVRGLLCGDCNRALGLVRDDLMTLERMIRHLRAA